MKHSSAAFGGLKYLKFLGKKRQNIFFGFFSLIERAYFVKNLLFGLSCVLDYFQLNTQSRKDRSLASFSNTHLSSLVHFQMFSIMPRSLDLSSKLGKTDRNAWYSRWYRGHRPWWCWVVRALRAWLWAEVDPYKEMAPIVCGFISLCLVSTLKNYDASNYETVLEHQ